MELEFFRVLEESSNIQLKWDFPHHLYGHSSVVMEKQFYVEALYNVPNLHGYHSAETQNGVINTFIHL